MRDNDRIIELLANHQIAARQLLIDLARAEASPETLTCIARSMQEAEHALTAGNSILATGQLISAPPYPTDLNALTEIIDRSVKAAMTSLQE